MRVLSTVATAATALLLVLTAPVGAVATDSADDGLWYYSATGMQDIHARTTGEGVTIAVLDDPIKPDVPELAGTDLTITQPSYCADSPGGAAVESPTDGTHAQHGTLIASLLLGTGQGIDGAPGVRGIAPGASVIGYTIRSASDAHCYNPAGTAGTGDQAFRDAVAAGAKIINVSGTMDLSSEPYVDALRAGVIVVSAAGNLGGPVSGAPATMNGSVTVGTVTADRTLDENSPTGPELGVVAPGTDFRCLDDTLAAYAWCTGSSNSAAYTSGVLALLWSLHPDATSNQILQALVHTTDGEVRDTPVRDDAWGFGTVNARLLMDSDPSSYPDVNPFVRNDADAWPATAELAAPTTPGAAPEDDEADVPASPGDVAEPDEGGSTVVIAVVVVIALVLIAGAAAAVVVSRRRRQRAPAPGPDRPHQPTQHGGHHG